MVAPLAIGAICMCITPKMKMSDKRKIEKISQNFKIGVNEKENKEMTEPIFHEDDEIKNGTKYTFTFPLDLSSKVIQKLQENGKVFSDGLNTPVDIEFNGMLHII